MQIKKQARRPTLSRKPPIDGHKCSKLYGPEVKWSTNRMVCKTPKFYQVGHISVRLPNREDTMKERVERKKTTKARSKGGPSVKMTSYACTITTRKTTYYDNWFHPKLKEKKKREGIGVSSSPSTFFSSSFARAQQQHCRIPNFVILPLLLLNLSPLPIQALPRRFSSPKIVSNNGGTDVLEIGWWVFDLIQIATLQFLFCVGNGDWVVGFDGMSSSRTMGRLHHPCTKEEIRSQLGRYNIVYIFLVSLLFLTMHPSAVAELYSNIPTLKLQFDYCALFDIFTYGLKAGCILSLRFLGILSWTCLFNISLYGNTLKVHAILKDLVHKAIGETLVFGFMGLDRMFLGVMGHSDL
uniref:Uncharacterized protein n=1 Tax=Cucumis melo TaxID=3656 RepID=A0A9I9ELK4_CUCME